MKLFTAIVALAGMSSATASLRGGAVLPSDMKDLLNKLVAADEGVANCDAVVNQKCDELDATVNCPPNTVCNWVGSNFHNVPGATEEGSYCRPNLLEENELVEESAELESASPSCGVLGSADGGCVVNGIPGLSCKAGYTCEGYAPGTNPTLGKCVLDTNRDVDQRTPATICNEDFYAMQIPCTNNGACHNAWANPHNCETRCANGVCAAPTFEEEEEELAATKDFVASADTCLFENDSCANSNGLKCCVHTSEGGYTTEGIACIPVGINNKLKCQTTDVEEEEEELAASGYTYDTVPAEPTYCLPENAVCALSSGGDPILDSQGKRCCLMTVETDGSTTYSHSGITCNYVSHPNAVSSSDAGASNRCVQTDGEDLAVN